MKIADIRAGEQYGAVDDPRYTSRLPRQVEVVEIVVVPQTVWGRGYSSSRSTRNVRQCSVKFLDDAQIPGSTGWRRDNIAAAKKGSTLTIEPKQIVEKWSKLAPDIQLRIARQQREDTETAELEARLNALLPKKLKNTARTSIHVRNDSRKRGEFIVLREARLEEETLETILALAEKGQATV